jgi:hypothetical protein
LDGLGAALFSEGLTRNDINTIWDDRALNHAYQVFGGMPMVVLEGANDVLPEDLQMRLSEMTSCGTGNREGEKKIR